MFNKFLQQPKAVIFAMSKFCLQYFYYRFCLKNCDSTRSSVLMLRLLHHVLCWLCSNLAFPLHVSRLFIDSKVCIICSPVKKPPNLARQAYPRYQRNWHCWQARHFDCVVFVMFQKLKCHVQGNRHSGGEWMQAKFHWCSFQNAYLSEFSI